MKENYKKYLITAAIALAVTLSIIAAQGVFSMTEPARIYTAICDGFTATGALLVCIGLLIFSSNHGAFDMLSYGISVAFTARFKKNNRKHKDFYEYREARKEHAKGYGFLIWVGSAFLAVAVALLIFAPI